MFAWPKDAENLVVPIYQNGASHDTESLLTPQCLAAHDARKAELVKLRYFVGMTIEQAADALGISEATAKRDWAYARAWLHREINRQHS